MPLMRFVQVHNISREEFDSALNILIEAHEWFDTLGFIDLSIEDYELPNADIIFTFDNEIIRYYYRRW